jgi:hypothetical protein
MIRVPAGTYDLLACGLGCDEEKTVTIEQNGRPICLISATAWGKTPMGCMLEPEDADRFVVEKHAFKVQRGMVIFHVRLSDGAWLPILHGVLPAERDNLVSAWLGQTIRYLNGKPVRTS